MDATPLARPMLAVLGEYSRACVLVVNREVAPVWEMYQDEMREVETVREPLRKGGNTGSRVLELAAVGGLAALGPQDCLWAGSMSVIDTLLVRDGTTLPGVVCDKSRWPAASGDTCPVCGKPTRHTPDVLDELAAAVIETGGSARRSGRGADRRRERSALIEAAEEQEVLIDQL